MESSNRIHSGTLHNEPSKRELANAAFARRAAAEGFVLLKNDGLLPLKESASVALFGNGAYNTVKGGIGSGDVNNRESISIYRGLKDAGVNVTSEDWLHDYEKRYDDARLIWKEKILEDAKRIDNLFDAYALNPFVMPEGCTVAEEDIRDASAAVYVISRIAGEGKDRRRAEGDYYLSQKEQEDILYLDRKNIPTVLILNAGAPVELTDILLQAKNIKAILNISLPGQEGGHAAADVLLGKAAPGGRLTATWAARYEDYPSAGNYSHLNGDLEKEEYREGIYVGYRYFDNFGIKPLFPFGFGLSYTTFETKFKEIRITQAGAQVTVTVENTGEIYSGREVVQVYVTPPQTGLEKEYRRLAGFAKTDVLAPKEVQELTVLIEIKQLASFFEPDQAWLLEAGKYGVWIGEHIESLQLAAVLSVSENFVLEQTHTIFPHAAVQEISGRNKLAQNREKEWHALAENRNVPVLCITPKQEEKRVLQSPYAKEQPIEDLIPLLYGNIAESAGALGSAGIHVPGSAGETTDRLMKKYGKRFLVMADGPAGIRLRQSYEVDRKTDTIYNASVLGSLENGFLEDTEHHEDADTYYQFCTAFPVGTALAQTWDTELMREFGEAIAVEMEEFHVDLWLAPGINIHRNPLCGRNFEYYSEDPFLSGMMAAAATAGVQKNQKCGVTIKHFACNNQEDNRMGVDARISQRALREIYLRGFEIAVKKSAPMAIMTSYNKINGIHAANCREICTAAARDEWGFEGVIMTDWATTAPAGGSEPWRCADAGNDIIMPGSPKDAENIREAYAQGKLSEEAIRGCAGRILALIDKLM